MGGDTHEQWLHCRVARRFDHCLKSAAREGVGRAVSHASRLASRIDQFGEERADGVCSPVASLRCRVAVALN
jgi:hypothetical protein